MCRRCVMRVDSDNLTLDTVPSLELEELADVPPTEAPDESAGHEEIRRLKDEISRKDKEYSDLKAKSDLVYKSFDQVTKKIETIVEDYGVAQDIIATQKLKIQKCDEKIINLEIEKA